MADDTNPWVREKKDHELPLNTGKHLRSPSIQNLPAVTGSADDIAAVKAQLNEILASLATLTRRLDALEQNPAPSPVPASPEVSQSAPASQPAAEVDNDLMEMVTTRLLDYVSSPIREQLEPHIKNETVSPLDFIDLDEHNGNFGKFLNLEDILPRLNQLLSMKEANKKLA